MAEGIIHECVHCLNQCNGKFCPQCSTAKGRQEMDEANAKYFAEQGLPPYVCEGCIRMGKIETKIELKEIK